MIFAPEGVGVADTRGLFDHTAKELKIRVRVESATRCTGQEGRTHFTRRLQHVMQRPAHIGAAAQSALQGLTASPSPAEMIVKAGGQRHQVAHLDLVGAVDPAKYVDPTNEVGIDQVDQPCHRG